MMRPRALEQAGKCRGWGKAPHDEATRFDIRAARGPPQCQRSVECRKAVRRQLLEGEPNLVRRADWQVHAGISRCGENFASSRVERKRARLAGSFQVVPQLDHSRIER